MAQGATHKLVPGGSVLLLFAQQVMKMIMTLNVQESGRVNYIKRPGAVLEAGCVVARLELDDPSKVHPVWAAGPLSASVSWAGSTRQVLPTPKSLQVHRNLQAPINARPGDTWAGDRIWLRNRNEGGCLWPWLWGPRWRSQPLIAEGEPLRELAGEKGACRGGRGLGRKPGVPYLEGRHVPAIGYQRVFIE